MHVHRIDGSLGKRRLSCMLLTMACPMDAEIIKTVSQTAGIGGVALGIYLILFRDIIRKQIFPELSKQHAFRLLRLIAVLVWSVAVLGMAAWIWTVTPPVHRNNDGELKVETVKPEENGHTPETIHWNRNR